MKTPDYGEYERIIPPIPSIQGVRHIKPRRVPLHIQKPPYALINWSRLHKKGESWVEPYEGDGLIALGTEEEDKLRRSASLAKKVLDFAGTLVHVSIFGSYLNDEYQYYLIIISHRRV